MDPQRKYAYRWLLYWAMLDIRPLGWMGRRWFQCLNPVFWWRRASQIRCAGSIAEWLHNLALFSYMDFRRFDEDRFWKDYQWMLDRNPDCGLDRYRMEFERRATYTLKELSAELDE